MLTCPTVKLFPVALRIIPAWSLSADALKEGVNFLSLCPISGHLEVNLVINDSLKGSFKTSHRGSIVLDHGELPPSFSGTVYAKQLYFADPGKSGLRRYDGSKEQALIHAEGLCLDWAVLLLDLTYSFIEDFQTKHGNFPGIIPHLCFVEAAVAECRSENKYFLIEECINTSKTPFTKYIHNGLPVPIIPRDAPTEVLNTANFLCFAQHVQFQVTGGMVYTSDYQGMFIITGYVQ